MMLDPNGAILHWSAAAERLQGFTGLEIIGKHYSSLFPADDLKLGKPDQCLKIAEADGRHEQVGTRVRKDGSTFLAHTIVTPLRDGESGLRGFSVVSRDVTEQKRSEDLLKKLALTVEQAADLMIITDPAGNVEFLNRAVEKVTGYSREELMGRGLALLQPDQQDPARSRTMWETVLSGRTFEAEMVCTGKDGQYIHLDAVAAPIKGDAGSVTHIVFTCSDMTHVKLMRDRLDYLASYDAMTGLPNRGLFAERLDRDLSAEGKGKKSRLPCSQSTLTASSI